MRLRQAILLGLTVLLAVVWGLNRLWVQPSRVLPARGSMPAKSPAGPARLPGLEAGVPAKAGEAPMPGAAAVARPAAAPAAPRAGAEERDRIPREYVLRFYDERDQAAFVALAKAGGATVLNTSPFGHAVRLRVRDDAELERLLAGGPPVVAREANRYVHAPKVPTRDPQAPRDGYEAFGSLAMDWLGGGSERAGAGVKVAVLDNGVGTHPALSEARIERVVLTPERDGVAPGEEAGHATAVASLIAGASAGIHGVAPESRILSVKVMTSAGEGDAFTLAQGIVEAVDRGARVLNLCLGTYGQSSYLEDAVRYAQERGAILVAATGNDAVEGVMNPARYDGVLAVGAVDARGQHLYFSNRGPEVDLAAPGLGVRAAWTNGQDAAFSGTSAAVPFVSGALAALMSETPGLTAEEAARILLSECDDLGLPGVDAEYGNGVLNLRRVQQRAVPGIFDVGVGPAGLTGREGEKTLVLYVQNRGTEPLPRVDLNFDIDGAPGAVSFYDLAVGRTASREFALNQAQLERLGQVRVRYTAVLPGQADAYPEDNQGAAVVYLKPAP